jgi:hypothetical protein
MVKGFLFSRPTLGSTQPPIQWVPGAAAWSRPLPPYAFMAYCLITYVQGQLPFNMTGNDLYRFNHKHHHHQNKNLTLQQPILISVHVKSPDYSFVFIMWLIDNQLKNITYAYVMKITGHLDHRGATLLSCQVTMCCNHVSIPNTPLFQFLLRHFHLRHSTPGCLDPQLLQLKFHAITKIIIMALVRN